jgi:zinc/manganese transport system permease protein
MRLSEFFWSPFADYIFMRRALATCISLATSCGAVGIWLVLRRMSLMGDALSHAVLPGAAVGYLVAGLSLPAMSLGGMIGALGVALLAGLASRHTPLYEDASLAGFYLLSMALGVVLVSARGGNVDLMHVLFGTLLGVNQEGMVLVATTSTLSLLVLALIYRPLLIESFDPLFLRSVNGRGSLSHMIFITLVVLNLVAAFQVLGTLMALGLMMLPAVTARLWGRTLGQLSLIASLIGVVSSYLGLLVSYHGGFPSGPSIILVAGALYCLSLLVKMMKRLNRKIFAQRLLVFACLAGALPASGTENIPPRPLKGFPLQVVATFSILGDLVRQVGGDLVQVHVIVGPNGDAHVYEPTPADARLLAQADVIFINGLGLEGWIDRLIQASSAHSPQVVVSQGIQGTRWVEGSGSRGGKPKERDPHIWHNVRHAQHMVRQITHSLSALYPEAAPTFQKRAAAYEKKLTELDDWAAQTLGAIPRAHRRVITMHDGFSYFGERYQIDFLAPVGITTEAEPSAQTIGRFIDQAKAGSIKAIFMENICNPRLLAQIAEEAKVKIGGTLYSDALSPPEGPAADYMSLVRHNVMTISQALCSPLETSIAPSEDSFPPHAKDPGP